MLIRVLWYVMAKILPDRKYNRLPEYDYTSPGYYFVTICIQDKRCHFGKVADEQIVLNKFGMIVDSEWKKLINKYTLIRKDNYVVMPNHFHGILIIDDVDEIKKDVAHVETTLVGTAHELSLQQENLSVQAKKSLSTYIGEFKMLSSKKIHEYGLKQFKWQRSFYDRIIRNEFELYNIRNYIDINPLKWGIEKTHPENLDL